MPCSGFKIDGIGGRAGKIPTGKPKGRNLTLDVDGFVDLYAKDAALPFNKNKPGTIADLICTSKLVYSSGPDGDILYQQGQK